MKRWSGYVAAILMVFAMQAFSADFEILTEELPPFNYTQAGEVTGFSAEIVVEICKRVGHPTDIQVMPWTRAYRKALKEDNRILFSTTRTSKRESLFKWVGPIYRPTIVFYRRTASGLDISSMDDAKKVESIGTYVNDAEETLLKEAGFTNLQSVGNDFLNAKKLARGRISLWITGDLEGIYKAKEAKVDTGQIEIAYEIKTKDYYLAFSQSTSDAEIARWQAALDEMRKDGTYETILNRYLR